MPNTYTDVWNPAYEGQPADTESVSLGAGRIRDLKLNVRERVQYNHSFNGDGNDGKHTIVMLMVQSADPTLDTGDGGLYSKAVSGGATELFFKDSNGVVSQLTGLSTTAPINTMFRMWLSATQAASATSAPVPFDTVEYDTGSGNRGGGQWACPVAGYYWLHSSVQYSANSAQVGSTLATSLFVNGGTVAEMENTLPAYAAPFAHGVAVATLQHLSVGDVVNVYAGAAAMSAPNLDGGTTLTYFEGMKVG